MDGAQDLGQATRAPLLCDLLEDGPQLTRDLALGGGRSRIVDGIGAGVAGWTVRRIAATVPWGSSPMFSTWAIVPTLA